LAVDESRGQEEQEAMRPLNYQIMFEVEDEHWWFVGRRAIILNQIEGFLQRRGTAAQGPPPLLLDIGCGTGATLDALEKFGSVQGIDVSRLALGFSRLRGHDRVACASATELPFPSETFDLVTALDVIEHLDDDVAGLREIRRVLKPGSSAILFVPAFPSLWGPNDDQSGHRRRYRRRPLIEVVQRAGLEVVSTSYANVAMFGPIWLGRRLLTLLGRQEEAENRINHPALNRWLARIFAAEAQWLRRHSFPFGVSLLCVARRPLPDLSDPLSPRKEGR
jgi:SAM-dependent methyltransferase